MNWKPIVIGGSLLFGLNQLGKRHRVGQLGQTDEIYEREYWLLPLWQLQQRFYEDDNPEHVATSGDYVRFYRLFSQNAPVWAGAILPMTDLDVEEEGIGPYDDEGEAEADMQHYCYKPDDFTAYNPGELFDAYGSESFEGRWGQRAYEAWKEDQGQSRTHSWSMPFENESGGVIMLAKLGQDVYSLVGECLTPESSHREWVTSLVDRMVEDVYLPMMVEAVAQDEGYYRVEAWREEMEELWEDYVDYPSNPLYQAAWDEAGYFTDTAPGQAALADYLAQSPLNHTHGFWHLYAGQLDTPAWRKERATELYGAYFEDSIRRALARKEWFSPRYTAFQNVHEIVDEYMAAFESEDGYDEFQRQAEPARQERQRRQERYRRQEQEEDYQQRQHRQHYQHGRSTGGRGYSASQQRTSTVGWDSDRAKRLLRKLAIVYHPDKGGSTAVMATINDAYDRQDMATLEMYADQSGVNLDGLTLGQVADLYQVDLGDIREVI